jgi:hypothetical protein
MIQISLSLPAFDANDLDGQLASCAMRQPTGRRRMRAI